MNDVISRSKSEIVKQQRTAYVALVLSVAFAAYAGKYAYDSQIKAHEAQEEKAAAEEQQRVSLQRAELMIESSPWAMVVCDIDGHITEVNAAAEKMLGWSPSELVGKKSDIIVPEDQRQLHDDGLKKAAARIRESQGNWILTSNRRLLTVLKKDGTTFDAAATVRAIKYGERVDFILSLTSVSKPPAVPLQLQRAEPLTGMVCPKPQSLQE